MGALKTKLAAMQVMAEKDLLEAKAQHDTAILECIVKTAEKHKEVRTRLRNAGISEEEIARILQ